MLRTESESSYLDAFDNLLPSTQKIPNLEAVPGCRP